MYGILTILGWLAAVVGAVLGASFAAVGQFRLSNIFIAVEVLGGILMIWSIGKTSFDKSS